MARSLYPSKVSLPQQHRGFATVLEFLIFRFPGITSQQWKQRAQQGNLHWQDGELITKTSAYKPCEWVYYYREVDVEKIIPVQEGIVYQDEHILIAYKPSFLPVMPGGNYVNECLQNRLRKKTGIDDLIALHRLDRETSGLLMFSLNPETRPLYHALFSQRKIQKTYQAVAHVEGELPVVTQTFVVKNRLVKSTPSFLMCVKEGQPNSHSKIHCIDRKENRALFELQPVTGKTHQLRVHMQSLGWPLLNDRFYPQLMPKDTDDYDKPLQLLAKRLNYRDPVSHKETEIVCEQSLSL
ncbi:MAG: pseudouridine synthase [Pseudomonadales bacterium]|nr:pseudouridine synthase [Pseudomonadales bacterium]